MPNAGPGGPGRGDLLDRAAWVHIILLTVICWIWTSAGAVLPGLDPTVQFFAAVPFSVVVALGLRWAEHHAARLLVGPLNHPRGDPLPPSYSVEEGWIVRGDFDRAADLLLTRMLAHPDELETWFRLAEVHWRHRRDWGAAEEVYRELGERELSPGARRRLDTVLVDLFEASGDRSKLRAALTRVADRYRGTPPAAGAVRRLQELGEG